MDIRLTSNGNVALFTKHTVIFFKGFTGEILSQTTEPSYAWLLEEGAIIDTSNVPECEEDGEFGNIFIYHGCAFFIGPDWKVLPYISINWPILYRLELTKSLKELGMHPKDEYFQSRYNRWMNRVNGRRFGSTRSSRICPQ